MGANSKIEWTDATWNPIMGCSRVSEGCRNCYAERMAGRFRTNKKGVETVYSGLTQIVNGRPAWTGQIRETKTLLEPLSWRSPKRVFVNSMSDLFQGNVTDAQRDKVFAVMALCPQHRFQILTKRPERMLRYFTEKHRNPQGWPKEDYDVQTCVRLSFGGLLGGRKLPNGKPDVMNFFRSGRADRYGEADERVFKQWPLKNVWLGVSIENQAAADERVPLLSQTPAAVRFVSCEPLLGPVEFSDVTNRSDCVQRLGEPAMNGIDWVICGGESGPNARPMHPDWARGLRDQCAAASVPFFFKQWGEWLPGTQYEAKHRAIDPDETQSKFLCMDWDGEKYFECGGGWMDEIDEAATFRVGKKAAGSLLDGVEHKAFPVL